MNRYKRSSQYIPDRAIRRAKTAAGVVVLLLAAAGLACNLPAATSPTPFVFPTPDLTLTAIYSVLTTPTPLAVHTATPVQFPTEMPASTTPPILETFIPETPVQAAPTTQAPAPTETPTATSPPAATQALRPGPVVEAVYLHTPPGIDGNLNEWSIPSHSANHITFGANFWDNPEDISARFMVGWDFNHLYIAARVTDEDYVQNASGEQIYLGDSLEILLDRDLAGDFEETSLNGDDYQLGISPGQSEPGQNPEAYLWFPRDKAGPRPEVQIGARRTDDGWDIEAAIPWGVFELQPRAGGYYGFVFSVSDNDRTGRLEQQTVISNVRTRSLGNPTTWGNLMLGQP